MFYPDFELLGLSETEGKVYVTLLELGGGYVSVLARRAKLPRVNCYHTLENLAKKGLVSSITKDGVRYYTAEPPQKIANILEEKAQYAQKFSPNFCRSRTRLLLSRRLNILKESKVLKIF